MKRYKQIEYQNQKMREFIGMLSNLTYFSHRQECQEILKEVEKTDILPQLEKLDDLKRKLNSKYDDSISAILDWVFHNEEPQDYNKVHEVLFKYKGKIKHEED